MAIVALIIREYETSNLQLSVSPYENRDGQELMCKEIYYPTNMWGAHALSKLTWFSMC